MITTYCTAAQTGQRLSPTATSVGTAHDDPIDLAIEQGSRWIDAHVGDCFHEAVAGDVATARKIRADKARYDRDMGWVLEIPWCSDVDTVELDTGDGNTWTTYTDYYTLPLDGWKDGQSGWPADRIVFPNTGLRTTGRYPVARVTGQFTWTTRPSSVTQCAIDLTGFIVQSRDTKGGFMMFGEAGIARARADGLFRQIDHLRRVGGMGLGGCA